MAIDRIVVKNCNVVLRMYDGLDWHNIDSMDDSVHASDPLSNSSRSEERIEVHLQGLGVVYETFPETSTYTSRVLVLVQQLEILDRVS